MSMMTNGLAPSRSEPAAAGSPIEPSHDAERQSDAASAAMPAEAATPAPETDGAPRRPTPLDREQILNATADCLAEAGYDGTTIRAIARRLRCAVGSIYRYFEDKRSLLSAVTQRRFEPVETALEAGLPLDQVVKMYVRIAGEEPEQYRLMYWLASVGRPRQAGIEAMPAVIRRILDRWARRAGDRAAAMRHWAQVHGGLMLGELTEGAAARATRTTPTAQEASEPTARRDTVLEAHAPSDPSSEQAVAAAHHGATRDEREDLTML